ncbi:MAG: T9SS type A sorting domain-containing protein [Lentimicrobium sp.]|nr:T9SS type A sorting domain-containing protein [Lentimicrobium sp.]
MKKNALLFLLFACFSTFVHSQETFFKKYISSDDKAIYSIIETDDNNLMFCGIINTTSGNSDKIGTMSKINQNGDFIDTRNYDFGAGNSGFAELINTSTTNGYYYLLGSQDSIAGNQTINSVFVHTIDDEMNIVTRRIYGMWTESMNSSWDFELLGDTTAYILSILTNHNSPQGHFSVIKADLLNNDFAYYKSSDSISQAASSLIIDKISGLIKVNYRVFNTGWYPTNPVANISYDLMNIEVIMPENEFFSQTKIGNKNDSTYLLSGAFIDDNTLQRDLGVAEYNLSDSLLKQIKLPGGLDSVTYPGSGKRNILITSNYIWVLGWYNTLASGFPCQNEPTWILLNKLNHDLELQEQLFYGGDGVYFPNDIIETSDKHIVVAGKFYNNLAVPYNCHFDPFVLKVNSEGLIVNTTNHDLPIAQEAIVFPNPGSGYLQVKLAIQHPQATLELFDMNGRLILTEEIHTDMQQVNTSSLSTGIYPYLITANGKVIGNGKWVKE